MLSSYFEFDLLGVVGLIIIKILLFLVELAFYGASLLCIFFIIKGFIKIPEMMGKIFIFCGVWFVSIYLFESGTYYKFD